MVTFVAVVCLPGTCTVGVQGLGGWREAEFPNTPAGMQALLDFALASASMGPRSAILSVLGWLDSGADTECAAAAFARAGVVQHVYGADAIRAAAYRFALRDDSPQAVAAAHRRHTDRLHGVNDDA